MFFLIKKTFSPIAARFFFIGVLGLFLLQPSLRAAEKSTGYFRPAKPAGILEKIEKWFKDPLAKKQVPKNPYVRKTE